MLDFLKQNKKVIAIVLAIIMLGGYYIYNSKKEYTVEEQEILVSENTVSEDKEETKEEVIAVHITGAVKTPGVVRVKEKSRIEDVIEAAGGLIEDADITSVNLAYIVDDGMKIKIPSINDELKQEEYIVEDSGKGVIISNGSSLASNSVVNINTATQTELETLNGIGTSLAGKIIEYRESHGKFKKIDDIKNVSGIGDSKFESIKDFIEV